MSTNNLKTRVELLDYLRGIMAIMVLIYHYSSWSNFQYMYPFDQTLSRLGIYAVSAFYVISGASLALVYFNKQVNIAFLKDFSIKRVFRIAPLFYVATTLTLLLLISRAVINKDFSLVPDFKQLLLNYTLLFGWVSPDSYIATGAWSIGNELVFYSIFPIMLYLKNKTLKHYFVFFLVTIFISMYISIFVLDGSGSLTNQWGSYINPLNQLYLFSGGFFIGTLFKKGIKINKTFLLSLFVIAILLFVFIPVNGNDRISFVVGYPKVILSVAVFSFCLFATFWGNIKKNGLTTGLKFFGDISYSVYLIHPVVFKGLGAVLAIFPIFKSQVIFVLIATVITIVTSMLVYTYIEKPFMGKGRTISNKYVNKSIELDSRMRKI